ncbi:MAG: hypothetical protein CML20_18340 [Rheinheimera sp.]|nr:hypothetical protein [Rheinheimera sp.]
MKKHKVWLKVLFFAAMLLASPHEVFANDNEGENELIFAEDDILLQGIRGLVGSAANIIVGEDTPSEPDHLIAEIMLTYNFGLMAVATIFMLFRGAKWLLQLSAEKKDDGILDFQSAPLPIALAVILMMPLPDGYSAIQHLILKVIGQSISLANEETYVAADFLDRVGSFSVNPTIMASEKIAMKMVESSICMAAINKSTGKTNVYIKQTHTRDLEQNLDRYTLDFDGVYSRAEAASTYFADIAGFGDQGLTTYYPKRVCGSVSLTFGAIDQHYMKQESILEFRRNVMDSFHMLAKSTSLTSAKFVDELFDPIGQNATGTHSYNTSYNPSIPEEIKRASDEFIRSYRYELERLLVKIEASKDDASSGLGNKKSTDTLRKYGAAYLGAYFWEYAKRNSVVTELTSLKNSSKYPMLDQLENTVNDKLYESLTLNQQALFDELMNSLINKDDNYDVSEYIKGSANIEKDVLLSIKNAEHQFDIGANYLFEAATATMYSETDPVLAMADTGHQFIIIGETIIGTTAAAMATVRVARALAEGTAEGLNSTPIMGLAAAAPKTLAVTLEAAEMLGSLLIPLGIAMIFFGGMIAFWLPSIPLIHWVNGTIGFMILFMQAFLLTPLLGLAHLLSGEKGFFSSKTQHGYMSIIQLFTYFPIMVITFFISYLIAMFGLKFFQVIYLQFMASLNGNNIAGIATFLFITAIFIIITIQIVNRCFSLVTTMTEKAGKFIGGGEEMLGDSGAADKGKSGFVAFSGSAQKGTANTVQAAGPKNKNSEKDKPDEKQLQQSVNSKTK